MCLVHAFKCYSCNSTNENECNETNCGNYYAYNECIKIITAGNLYFNPLFFENDFCLLMIWGSN